MSEAMTADERKQANRLFAQRDRYLERAKQADDERSWRHWREMAAGAETEAENICKRREG